METVSILEFPDLYVPAGRNKLKLHDSAVMFEQGVWFSVLIMLPQARPP